MLKPGRLLRAQIMTAKQPPPTSNKIPSRRCQFEMPRSISSVRPNEDPRKCRFNVDKINHQPVARIHALPPNRFVTSVSKKVVVKIRNCDRASLKWINPRRLIGAGNKKAT